jgi:hypothetical protein
MIRTELACPTCQQKYLMEFRPGHADRVAVHPFVCDCKTELQVEAALPILVYKLDSNGDWNFADTIGATV